MPAGVGAAGKRGQKGEKWGTSVIVSTKKIKEKESGKLYVYLYRILSK